MGKCKQINNCNLLYVTSSHWLFMKEIMRFRRRHVSYLKVTQQWTWPKYTCLFSHCHLLPYYSLQYKLCTPAHAPSLLSLSSSRPTSTSHTLHLLHLHLLTSTSHTPKSNIVMTVFQAAHLILVFFVTCESHQQFPLLAVLEKKSVGLANLERCIYSYIYISIGVFTVTVLSWEYPHGWKAKWLF